MIDLTKYDCVGFDLDNTIVMYNVPNLSPLIYESIAEILISQKGYPSSHLKKSFSCGLPFLQKGLAFDVKRGNIVKLGEFGIVLRASHGSRMLTSDEISEIYGTSNIWDMAEEYCRNPLQALKGPMSEHIRCVLDIFDIPCLLVYARAVDSIDEISKDTADYPKVWADILECLEKNYDARSLSENRGFFFPAVKGNTNKYYQKCPDELIKWIEQLKRDGKLVFLITGGNCEYASFTSSNLIGPGWTDLFDFVVFEAKKPTFFSGQRPYLSSSATWIEGDPCKLSADSRDAAQGNWKEFAEWMKSKKGDDLDVIYIGDHMLQDVLAPVQFGCCETVAITGDYTHSDENSSVWGSYFHDAGKSTFWNSMLHNTPTSYIDSLMSLVHGREYSACT